MIDAVFRIVASGEASLREHIRVQVGCTRGAGCPHSHSPITSVAGLHWTTQAALIMRGGLKNGKCINPSEIDVRIDTLRRQAAAEKQQKISETGRAEATSRGRGLVFGPAPLPTISEDGVASPGGTTPPGRGP